MAVPNQKLILRTCCSIHVLHDGMDDMLYALLPLLREAFGLTYAEVALVRSAHKSATAIFQIPVGIFAEKAGARNSLVFGTALLGVAFLGLGFANAYAAILALVFLAGCGDAFNHPLSSSIISNAFPGAGQRAALGTYNALGDVGKFIFLGVTIFATASLGFSWQVPVHGFGVSAIIIAISTFVFLKLANAGARSDPAAKHDIAGTIKGWGIKHRRGFFTLGAITALDSSTRYSFLTFVAFLMIEKGVATGWAASAVLATVFGGMFGKYAVGLMAEKIGVARTIMLTEITTAGLIIAVIIVPSVYAFFLLPLVGVFLNGTSSAIYGTVPDLIEGEKHSRAYGLIYTVVSASGFLSPLLYGLLADYYSITTTLIVVSAVVLLTVPLCGTLGHALSAAKSNPLQV
jgi:FSR family fosmidomycin resistance protein-like MFS transporter